MYIAIDENVNIPSNDFESLDDFVIISFYFTYTTIAGNVNIPNNDFEGLDDFPS